MLGNLLQWCYSHWYIIVIVGLGIAVLLAIMKILQLQQSPKFYSQVQENRKIKFKELEFNPTQIKKMIYKNKVYGVYGLIIRSYFRREKPKIKQETTKEYSTKEVKYLEFQNLKDTVLEKIKPDYITYEFLVKRKQFLGNIFYGDKEVIRLLSTDCEFIKTDTVKINDDVFLIYKEGFYQKAEWDTLQALADDTERLMGDLKVDSVGLQQKDFSRIRTDYAHSEVMKDKEIEAEEKKDKAKRHG